MGLLWHRRARVSRGMGRSLILNIGNCRKMLTFGPDGCIIYNVDGSNRGCRRDVPVAQPDRVFGYEPKGRGFESLQARHTPPDFIRSQVVFLCPEAKRCRIGDVGERFPPGFLRGRVGGGIPPGAPEGPLTWIGGRTVGRRADFGRGFFCRVVAIWRRMGYNWFTYQSVRREARPLAAI